VGDLGHCSTGLVGGRSIQLKTPNFVIFFYGKEQGQRYFYVGKTEKKPWGMDASRQFKMLDKSCLEGNGDRDWG